MSKKHSKRRSRNRKPLGKKPQKPAASFSDPKQPYPLTVNPCGYWSKKVKGQVKYFGCWAGIGGIGAEEAERRYNQQHNGQTDAEPAPEGLTIMKLANEYLNAKRDLIQSEDLKPRTFLDCNRTTDLILKEFGKHKPVASLRPLDFAALRSKMAKRLKSAVVLGNEVQRIRSVFKFAFDNDLITAPVKFGTVFKKPAKRRTKKEKREKRQAEGGKQFTAEEIRAMLVACEAGIGGRRPNPQLRAMILLAINTGCGNSDCGQLRMRDIDLDGGWLDYARPKTEEDRRAALWPETVQAIRAALAVRPEPTGDTDPQLVFMTQRGLSWHKEKVIDNPISKEMRKLLDALGQNGHRNFYALRHTYRTVAENHVTIPNAGRVIDRTMGHGRGDMASEYIEDISDERLRAVADCVRAWLFTTTP